MTVLSGTRWQGSGGGRREGDVRSSRPARVAARVKVGVLLVAVPRRPVLFWVPRKQSSRLRLPAAILVEREVPGDRRGRGHWLRRRADPPCGWKDIPHVRITVCGSLEGFQTMDESWNLLRALRFLSSAFLRCN